MQTRKKEWKDIAHVFDVLIQKLEANVTEVTEFYNNKVAEMLKRLERDDVDTMDGEARERERERLRDLTNQIEKDVESDRIIKIDQLKQKISTSYIMYMRIARRESEKSARTVFGMARKSGNITHHVYVYSALMEYHCSKDSTVAGRIFEFSLKSFMSDPIQNVPVVQAYLDFLIKSNDDTNTRAVFERAIANIPVDNAKPIWEKVIEQENKFGELNMIKTLEKRFGEVYSDSNYFINLELDSVSNLEALAARFSFDDLSYIADIELGVPCIFN